MHQLIERVAASALVALSVACAEETKRDEIASSRGSDEGLMPAELEPTRVLRDASAPPGDGVTSGHAAAQRDGAAPSAGTPTADDTLGTTSDSGTHSSGEPSAVRDASSRVEFPFDADQAVSSGSFEGNPGSGWDRCISKWPGLDSSSPVTGGAAHGERYLSFDSEAQCEHCSADGADSQVLFSLTEPIEPAPSGLWFEVRTNDLARPMEGTLAFVSTNQVCETQASLAAVELKELSMTEQWETRCISAPGEAPVQNLGMFVTGSTFAFSFDALRLGPPCEQN